MYYFVPLPCEISLSSFTEIQKTQKKIFCQLNSNKIESPFFIRYRIWMASNTGSPVNVENLKTKQFLFSFSSEVLSSVIHHYDLNNIWNVWWLVSMGNDIFNEWTGYLKDKQAERSGTYLCTFLKNIHAQDPPSLCGCCRTDHTQVH